MVLEWFEIVVKFAEFEIKQPLVWCPYAGAPSEFQCDFKHERADQGLFNFAELHLY